MTRIIAGSHGGRRLVTPAGSGTRPTSDRVREALFNSIESTLDLDGARVADLYAGSGAVGLEAASRGASYVLLVEADQKAARAARANIAALGAGAVVDLRVAKVEQVVAAPPPARFDLVFADPPYPTPEADVAAVLKALARGWLEPEALVVVERATRGPAPDWPPEITAQRGRRYGETTLWYGRAL